MMRILSLLFLSLSLLTSAPLSEAKPKKAKIIYRVVKNTGAYNRATSGQHLALKITPPEFYGAGQFIFVEIYNYTNQHLGQVDFDIFLKNNSWYNFDAHVTGDDILPKRSALRKIAVPKGKGRFPGIDKVKISNLKVYNMDASEIRVNTYVDLVRHRVPKKGKRRAK